MGLDDSDEGRFPVIANAQEKRLPVASHGRSLGMIVAKPHGYVVYALAPEIWPLDRRVFASLDAAESHIARCDRCAPA